MTTLDRRAVRRETRALEPSFRRRVLIVVLEQGGRFMRIKPKGAQRWYNISYEEIYRAAARVAAVELKAEKARKKAERKKARETR